MGQYGRPNLALAGILVLAVFIRLSVCLSLYMCVCVCVSVTCWYCIKMAAHIELVFFCLRASLDFATLYFKKIRVS